MATTETVAPLPVPTTDDEQVEKKASEEKKADDPICLETPAVDHEKIKPVVEVEKIVDAPVTVLNEAKVGNDPVPGRIEQPVEAEKNADAAVSDVPVVEESKVECDPIPDVPAEVVDPVIPVKIPEEVESSTESVVREAPEEPAIEIIGEGQVEQTKIVPQYSYEAIEKTEEPLQVTTYKESVETVPTEIKESEPESLEVHKPEFAAEEVKEKPGEPCEVTREVETKLEEVAPEKNVQDETVKDEGSAADMVEPIPFSEEGKSEAENTPSVEVEEAAEQPKVIEEGKTHDEVVPEKCLEDDTVKDEGSNKVEALTLSEKEQTDKNYVPSQVEPEEVLLNGNGADYSLPDAEEAAAPQNQKTEVTEADVVEKKQEEAAVEIAKTGGEVLEAKETEKDIVVSTEPIKEEEKTGLNGIDVLEKPAEEAPVELVAAAEENVETLEIQEKEKSNVVTEKSTQSIELDEKKEPSGLEGVEKLADEELVKLESVEEQNAETLEIEEKEKSNVVAGESTQPFELDKKKERGLDVVEKLKEEAEEVQKVEEKKVETEDGKSVITEDTVQPIYENEKKDLGEADVIEKSTDETEVKLKEVGEEDVVKIAETKESEKKDEIIENSSQPVLADQNKETNGVDEVEKLPEESEKVEEVIETKNVQSEDSDSKTVLEEVLTQQDKADVNSYISNPSEVIEKSFEEAGKDVEPAAETEKEEHIKVETPGIVETKKEDNVEEKKDEVKPSEPEVKGDEPVTLEKTTEEVAESDRNLEVSAKDGDDTKPSEDLPKELPAKSSQKQSNTILSKVKHTLVKAKRVITGKSPSSKTPASETKEDIKVK